jgi:hypothetical protein
VNVVARRRPTAWALRDHALWQRALRLGDEHRSPPADPPAVAEAAAAARAWLEALDGGDCRGNFERAALFLRRSLGASGRRRALKTEGAPLGPCLSRRIRSRRLVPWLCRGPRGPYAVIEFESEFEGRSSVVETLVPTIGNDGRWRVAGYRVA